MIGVAGSGDEGEFVDVVIDFELGSITTSTVVAVGVGRLSVVPHVPSSNRVA